jgi:hypothetical protein
MTVRVYDGRLVRTVFTQVEISHRIHAVAFAGLLSALPMTPSQPEQVPAPAVINGIPQGMFVGRSLLSGRAVCLLFLSGGRITRAIPAGGLEAFDWNRHRADRAGDAGTWSISNGVLRIAWGDGGVHQGPLTVHADSIEFYGKRYAKPAAATVAAIAGRWEAARGTAIAGGQGINTVSSLTITPDGRYQLASVTGGVVAGRAAAGERAASGRVTIKGLTIVFTSDDGPTRSFTFLPAGGTPVTAFSIDADLFTRVR